MGDSCLFQVRDETLIAAFPLDRAEQFSNQQVLLSSKPVSNQRMEEYIQFHKGNCQTGDLFLLATDALAQWILTQNEAGARPWAALCKLKTEEAFAAFMEALRQEGSLRNDDVTSLIIHIG